MKIIDISWPVSENITQFNDVKVIKFNKYAKFEQEKRNQSNICLDSHSGTHVDAPAHFIKDGKTLDKYNLDKLIGECFVLDLSDIDEKIKDSDLQNFDIKKDQIILLKTKNSFLDINQNFNYNFIYLDKSGAQYLASKDIKAVGIDYLGIERDEPNFPAHIILLSKEILIIEGLRLAGVSQGNYNLICLPLNLVNLEAAPARAILY